MDNREQNELRRLIDAMCDGALDRDDAARLNEQLAADPHARQLYLEQMWVEAELCSRYAAVDPSDPSDPAIRVDAAAGAAGGQSAQAGGIGRGKRTASRRLRMWLTLAASMLLAATISAWTTYQGVQGRGPLAMLQSDDADAAAAMATPAVEPVATVTGTRDCRWGEGADEFGFGVFLHPGQRLALTAGLAEVTFANGAQILLEGPSEMVVPDGASAELLSGKMSAAIPEAARGFAVRTSRVSIENPGTQFGLIVDANGATEVHVFEGPIRARAVGWGDRELSSVRLAAYEAARLSSISPQFTPMHSDDNLFVRTLNPSIGPAEGLLSLEEFNYAAGPIAWHNGGFGWAGPWVDLDLDPSVEGPATNAVEQGSLATSTLVAQGNRLVQSGQWNRVRRELSTSLRGVFDAAGLVEDREAIRLIGRDRTTVYISFLQKVSDVNDVFYGFELYRGDGNLNRVLCIGNGAEGTGYGVSSNTNGHVDPNIDYGDDRVCTPLFASLGEEDIETHLVVIRIDYGPENNDTVTVYRDPISLLDERECTPTAALEGDFAFDRVSLGNYNGVKDKIHEIDEIRIGTSFTAVTGRRSVLGTPLAHATPRATTSLADSGAILQNLLPNANLTTSLNLVLARPAWGERM